MDSRLTLKLRDLRSRLRRLYLAAGLLRVAAEVLGYLAVAYLLDRWVLFPQTVRGVLLVLALGVLAWRLKSLVLYPLRRRIGVEDMALAVEREHRDLAGDLASAVELAKVADQPPPDVSKDLLRVWLHKADSLGDRLQFDRIFRYRRLKQLLAVSGGLALLVLVSAVMQPQEAGVFLRRLMGSSVEWPRRTHLTLEIPGDSQQYRVVRNDDGIPTRVIVARSGSLPVLVRVDGTVPDEVFLVVDDGRRLGRSEEVRMLPREGEDGVFGYRFRNVQRPLTMHPQGGDDPGTRWTVTVEVQSPPSVERLVATMTPPAYTELPQVTEERQEFRVAAGTAIDLEVHSSGPVAEGTFTRNNDPSTEEALQVDPENPRRLLHSFVVKESGTFNLRLLGENGFRNLTPLDYVVTAVVDRRPTLEVLRPRTSSQEVTDRAVIPLAMQVGDDYGLSEVAIEYSRFGGEDNGEQTLLADRSSGEPQVLSVNLDLLTFQLPKEGKLDSLRQGETLIYHGVARDNHHDEAGEFQPNETKTQPRSLELVAEGEKTRKLADRQLRLKHAVAALRKNQSDKHAELQEIHGAGAEGMISSKELAATEVDQSRIGSRSRQLSRDFSEIVDEYIWNRLDTSPTAERVLLFRLAQLEQTQSAVRFEEQPLRALAAASEAGEFGQLDILGNLMSMLGLALDASEVHARAALQSLEKARITSDEASRPQHLAEALDHQVKFLETYDKLLEKMEEWEDFQEILELWRNLVDDQQDLNRAYRNQGDEK